MKNNTRTLKYICTGFLEAIISALIAIIIYYILYNGIYYLYRSYNYPLVNIVIKVLIYIRDSYLGEFIYKLIMLLIFLFIYGIVTYRKFNKISLLIENVEEMSKGDLDRKIEVKSNGDIGKLSNNINSIVEQLKNITVEERKAQQTKTDLITNVSHDLRTPLTSIIGYLNLIEEGKYKDEVELMYYADIAYKKSLNLNILINDLFELTKMQNNAIPFYKERLNLVELIRQVISQFEIQFKKANMECRVKFLEEKLMLDIDPIKLVRAFENLITNAMRYGKDGSYIDVNLYREENTAIVQVINYGEPIPVVDLPHIFDRFYRVEKSRNSVKGGSGLGLAITKNIIEAHNGTIEARSDNEKTIFEVKLPINELS